MLGCHTGTTHDRLCRASELRSVDSNTHELILHEKSGVRAYYIVASSTIQQDIAAKLCEPRSRSSTHLKQLVDRRLYTFDRNPLTGSPALHKYTMSRSINAA